MQALSRAALRASKNTINGYSDMEIRVREATSSDPYGPSLFQLSEISESSFVEKDCIEIITLLDKRLNDRGKLWRHVYKSLIVVEHLVLVGSRACVRYFRENLHLITTLKEFQHVDEEGVDQGGNVREKARNLTALLRDDERLAYERKHGQGSWAGSSAAAAAAALRAKNAKPAARSRASSSVAPPPQSQPQQPKKDELEEVLRISREEEERRKREVERLGGGDLFDDLGGKRDEGAFGQQGVDPNYAAQQQAMQLQMQYEAFARQQQQLAYEQQAQAQAQYVYQQQLLAQQQQQQQAAYEQQAYVAQMQQQQQQQQQAYYTHQEQQRQAYATQLALQQQSQSQSLAPPQTQPLQAQPTGYNNPFAAFASPSTTTTTQEQVVVPPPLPRANTAPAQQQRDDGKHAELARMLGNGGGVDTFGNMGSLRVPVGAQFATRTGF